MTWKIVTDSGCNFKQLENLKDGISYINVPLTLQVGDKNYIDDENLNVEKLMEEAYLSSGKTGSACPSPEAYKNASLGAENVLIFTITSALSGSYNSACIGRDMLLEENKDINIHVIDTKTAGGGQDLVVSYAQKLIEQEENFETVVEKLEEYVKKTETVFILEKVDNLVKNGRLSKFKAGVIGLLNIKLVGKATPEGRIDLLHKIRGSKKAVVTVVEEMINSGYKGGEVIISHCQNIDVSKAISELIKDKFPKVNIKEVGMKGLCSFYAEKNGLIVGYEI